MESEYTGHQSHCHASKEIVAIIFSWSPQLLPADNCKGKKKCLISNMKRLTENRFRLLYLQTGIKHQGTEWKYINKHTYDTSIKMPLELFSANYLAKSFPLPSFFKNQLCFTAQPLEEIIQRVQCCWRVFTQLAKLYVEHMMGIYSILDLSMSQIHCDILLMGFQQHRILWLISVEIMQNIAGIDITELILFTNGFHQVPHSNFQVAFFT